MQRRTIYDTWCQKGALIPTLCPQPTKSKEGPPRTDGNSQTAKSHHSNRQITALVQETMSNIVWTVIANSNNAFPAAFHLL